MKLKSIFSIFDHQNPNSLSHRMRLKRVGFFKDLMKQLPKPLRILDAGGTDVFWERMGLAGDADYHITIVNLEKTDSRYNNLICLAGDVTDLRQFPDQSFDLVFSNSVIEHVGTFNDQGRMAREIERLGKHYFLQTPNLYFPIEPHFLFPCFQFLPLSLKILLIRHFAMGWHHKEPEKEAAARLAQSVRLLNRRELASLFPGGTLIPEKFLGLTKSWMVIKGF